MSNGTERKVCLDLFAGLGGFSAAFADASDWDVYTVDVEERFEPDLQADILDLRPDDLLDLVGEYGVLVVLAGHPCTYFTYIRRLTKGGDGAWVNGEPDTESCRDHVAMVYHTLGLIEALSPDYWFLENPRGHLRELIGTPEATVWYCQYGHKTAKPTDLWGEHPPTFTPKTCAYGNDAWDHIKTESHKEHGGGSDNRQGLLEETDSAERAQVPYPLSEAIRDGVYEALSGSVPQQATLFQTDSDCNLRSLSTDSEQSGGDSA